MIEKGTVTSLSSVMANQFGQFQDHKTNDSYPYHNHTVPVWRAPLEWPNLRHQDTHEERPLLISHLAISSVCAGQCRGTKLTLTFPCCVRGGAHSKLPRFTRQAVARGLLTLNHKSRCQAMIMWQQVAICKVVRMQCMKWWTCHLDQRSASLDSLGFATDDEPRSIFWGR